MPGVRLEGAGEGTTDREERWRAYVRNIASGDTQSLARFYDESASILYGLALRMMRNEADAEEIILEVFDQIWRTASTFNPARGSILRWTTLLVRSRAVDRLRSAASKRERNQLTITGEWDLKSEGPLPDEASICSQERALVRQALGSLPLEQRQALELAYFSGLTHIEIATELGLPLGTVKTRIRAAHEKLRNALTQSGSAMERPQ